MIRTILFDMGGVIITINHQRAVERFKALGLKDAESWLDPYTQQGIFGQIEEGEISDEQFRQELSRLVGRELTWQECQHAWMGYMQEVPRRNLEMLQQLRQQGYRVVLLSNTNPFITEWVKSSDFDGEGHPLDHYLDAAYRSYECKSMKPSASFFRQVMEGEDLIPCETLFVDDGPRNIKAAEDLGINGLLVENGSDWRQALMEALNKFRS